MSHGWLVTKMNIASIILITLTSVIANTQLSNPAIWRSSMGCKSTPWGSMSNGSSNTAYSNTSPAAACSTVSESRNCKNAILSGSFNNTSCNDGCTGTPWGSVSHGYSNTAYSSSAPAGACTSFDETRSCSSGSFSGSYTNASCTNGCTGTPWGSVSHGYSNTAYSSSTPTGPCTSYDQTRSCSNGSLSGSYTNTSCTNGCAAQTVNWTISSNSCTSTSTALAHGGSGSVTDSTNPTTGTRNVSCSNGTLSNSGGSCTQACAGTLVGGYCWYLGAVGGSCDTACSSHGGYNAATRTYVGDQGTSANCATVLDALGATGDPILTKSDCSSGVQYMGCLHLGSVRIRCTNGATSGSGSYTIDIRACACNN